MSIDQEVRELEEYIDLIAGKWGGDITFLSPLLDADVEGLEAALNFKLPIVFRWLYTQKTNGLIIDNKSILPIYDSKNKRTFVENVNRFNDVKLNLYFKNRHHIFNDYAIVGFDHTSLICLSKKYDIENPLLYVCHNSNSARGVDFERMDYNLLGFIKKMVREALEEEDSSDLVLVGSEQVRWG